MCIFEPYLAQITECGFYLSVNAASHSPTNMTMPTHAFVFSIVFQDQEKYSGEFCISFTAQPCPAPSSESSARQAFVGYIL